jgi:hypothetical protein
MAAGYELTAFSPGAGAQPGKEMPVSFIKRWLTAKG